MKSSTTSEETWTCVSGWSGWSGERNGRIVRLHVDLGGKGEVQCVLAFRIQIAADKTLSDAERLMLCVLLVHVTKS